MAWQGIEAPKKKLIEKMNQINTKNYWKKKKEIVREVALGG